MKTVVSKHIITKTENIQFGYWDEDADEFVAIEKTGQYAKALERLGCSEALLDAVISLTASIREIVSSDLADIWERLDSLESK
jgi:hypothetical protein